MTNYVYYRLLGYLATIGLHGYNIYLLKQPVSEEVLKDYRIKGFLDLKTRFLTGWTFTLQLTFAIAGLLCDLLNLWNSGKKDYKLPKYLRGFRDCLFCGIVWPAVLVVFSFFWIIYTYDRSLVYPEFLDKVLSSVSNHIMHTAILPLALWEVYFQPRTQPKSHKRFMGHGIFVFFLYVFMLFYTYFERGIWVYPILREIFGTIYLPVFLIAVGVIALFSYFSQWYLVYLLWGNPEKPKKITKKNR